MTRELSPDYLRRGTPGSNSISWAQSTHINTFSGINSVFVSSEISQSLRTLDSHVNYLPFRREINYLNNFRKVKGSTYWLPKAIRFILQGWANPCWVLLSPGQCRYYCSFYPETAYIYSIYVHKYTSEWKMTRDPATSSYILSYYCFLIRWSICLSYNDVYL